MTNWIYLVVLFICFLCSLIDFRLHAFQLKLFSIFLGLTVLTEVVANIGRIRFHWATNYPIYNSFMLPEYCLYALFFRSVIHNRKVKRMLTALPVIFAIAWVYSQFLLLDGIATWNSYMVLFGDTVTVGMCAAYLIEIFALEEVTDLKTSATFWITSGTLMYSCCEIPITGRFNYLAHRNISATLWLLDVLQILNIVMYLTILYAYQCRRLINIMKSLLAPSRE